eukprot:CAMPEP_0170529786 /NCGR_PEP_ID=MMETSP0209-20121228/31258_1 /TAXON_ID=665100 ORGANISM="Litonotus pictus, Strain P1" /NCGR_SAMPLE_ID=MMETSP0209 /ASSEMBLY_ACC=CAM_ASM_000301 /LENGTH=73 /DNA_ID=CAMNT_0010822131 /DNA_START=1926 /DNA_END=2147 /DNA_ORIENTATION=+
MTWDTAGAAQSHTALALALLLRRASIGHSATTTQRRCAYFTQGGSLAGAATSKKVSEARKGTRAREVEYWNSA